ncbi:replication/maintenance protein RepL [Litorilituus lipolyticus]|uniref:Plasmid replication protein RepL domain-containing protein n=1 Tax=Litorilituus lipolyticus TaxID=2491017 RepID=A0A502KRI2_9GAMM|nr:replication/maintenance protein RepL [Litorilituus lipolyticus]TPH12785.1 hypothetical protein EPA86_15250 [Litorilituus lipolyticus]
MNTNQLDQIKELQKKLHFAETRNIRLEAELKKYQQQSNLNKYVQFFNRYQKLLRALLKENKMSFIILLFLCENMDKRNTFHITQKDLAKIFNVGERHVRQSIDLLKSHKIINVKKDGTTNYYIVNSNIAWKGSLENKRNSLFKVNPILLDLEVEKGYKKIIKVTVK